jgi:hypothetical protein
VSGGDSGIHIYFFPMKKFAASIETSIIYRLDLYIDKIYILTINYLQCNLWFYLIDIWIQVRNSL